MTITLWLEPAQIDDHNVMVAETEEIAWRERQKKRGRARRDEAETISGWKTAKAS
jgi:hypothetical protein